RASADPRCEHRLHLLGGQPRDRPDRGGRSVARLHDLRLARHAHRAAGTGRLLEAARRRPHIRVRPADVHHRRRRPARDPAHRYHAAARLLRRVERRRELPGARGTAPRLEPGEPGGVEMNKQISHLGVVALVLLTALIVGTTYWQTRTTAGLDDGQDKHIKLAAASTIKRGKIYAADGRTLVGTNVQKKIGGQTLYFRRYPSGPLFADVVGYSTQSRNRTGIEQSYNDFLTGSNANLDT